MTHEEQDAVRRALAATPPVGPMPPEVVARLEATIAGLAASRGDQPGDVVDLEERRRRRWPGVLVAAASVAVLAYGVGAVLPDLRPQAESASTDAAGGAVNESREGSQGGAEAAPELGPEEAAPGVKGPQALSEDLASGPVVELRTATLRRDVLRHVERESAKAADAFSAQDSGRRYARDDGTCVVPALRGGDEVVAARLDGRRATLVVGPVRGGDRVAEVYSCGDGRSLLARTVVPARR